MVKVVSFSVLLVSLFASTIAASAVPARRDDASATKKLFGGDGKPLCRHIKENQWDNCWLTACMCALAYLNPERLKGNTHIIEANGQDSRVVDFDTYDGALAKHTQRYTYSQVANIQTSRSGDAWWVGGLELATLAMGGESVLDVIPATAGRTFGGAYEQQGLQILTGKAVKETLPDGMPADSMLEFAKKSTTTPVIIGTFRTATVLQTAHAYSVLYVKDRNLILWNPTTGLEETWSIDTIWKDIGGFGHFVDFEKY